MANITVDSSLALLTPRTTLYPSRHFSRNVVISSRVFEKEIAEQIRHDLGCSNELILLYNV